jgi:hypothetical protein
LSINISFSIYEWLHNNFSFLFSNRRLVDIYVTYFCRKVRHLLCENFSQIASHPSRDLWGVVFIGRVRCVAALTFNEKNFSTIFYNVHVVALLSSLRVLLCCIKAQPYLIMLMTGKASTDIYPLFNVSRHIKSFRLINLINYYESSEIFLLCGMLLLWISC